MGAEYQAGYMIGRLIRGCIVLLFWLVWLVLLGVWRLVRLVLIAVWRLVAFPFKLIFGRRSP